MNELFMKGIALLCAGLMVLPPPVLAAEAQHALATLAPRSELNAVAGEIAEREMAELIRQLPLPEGHAHFGGSIPPAALWRLALHRRDIPESAWRQISEKVRSVHGGDVNLFAIIQEARELEGRQDSNPAAGQRLNELALAFQQYSQYIPDENKSLDHFVKVYSVAGAVSKGPAEIVRAIAKEIAVKGYEDGLRLLELRASLPPGATEEETYRNTLERIEAIRDGLRDAERQINADLAPGKVGLETRIVLTAEKHNDMATILRQTDAFLDVLRDRPDLREYVAGFDAANLESKKAPTEFIPVMQKIGAYNEQAGMQGHARLGLTYHVGEDFGDTSLESGIRHVQEVLEMGVGHIGHGLVLGIDMRQYLGQVSEERLSERLAQIYHDLRNAAFDADGLEAAGLVIDTKALLSELDSYVKEHDSLRDIARQIKGIVHDKPLNLAHQADLYAALNALRNAANPADNPLISIAYDERRVQELTKRQDYVLNKVIEHDAVIETNPTSNVYIGPIVSFSEHPIKRFLRHRHPGGKGKAGLAGKTPLVTINTDDAGIFGTNTATEYARIALGQGLSLGVIKRIAINGFRHRLSNYPLKFAGQIMNSMGPDIEKELRGYPVVSTRFGDVQFTVPSETARDVMRKFAEGKPFPTVYVLPPELFVGGNHYADLEFVIYFFAFRVGNGLKVTLVGTPEQEASMRRYLNHSLTGIAFDSEEWKAAREDWVRALGEHRRQSDLSTDDAALRQEIGRYEKIIDAAQESFAVRAASGSKKTFDDFLRFVPFENGAAEIAMPDAKDPSKTLGTVRVRRDAQNPAHFQVSERGVEKPQERDVWVDYAVPYIPETGIPLPLREALSDWNRPRFGYTVLNRNNGFDVKGEVSSFVFWVEKKGMLVDPSPAALRQLRQLGLGKDEIPYVLLTHNHADHDRGLLQWIFTGKKAVLLASAPVIASFKEKARAVLGEDVDAYVDFVTLLDQEEIALPGLGIQGKATIKIRHNLHAIPTIGFQLWYAHRGERHGIGFSGDDLFDGKDTAQMRKFMQALRDRGLSEEEIQAVMKQRREFFFDGPSGQLLPGLKVLIHEAEERDREDTRFIHTPLEALKELPQETRKNVALYHMPESAFPVKGFQDAGALQTVAVLPSDEKLIQEYRLQQVSLVSYLMDLSYAQRQELLAKAKSEYFPAGTDLITQGDYSFIPLTEPPNGIPPNMQDIIAQKTKGAFFVILSGEAEIIKNGKPVGTMLGPGTTAGEWGLAFRETRGATVRAMAGGVTALALTAEQYYRLLHSPEVADRLLRSKENLPFLEEMKRRHGREHPLHEFDYKIMADLSGRAETHSAEDGAVIMRHGEEADFACVIKSGTVRIVGRDGAELARLSRGDFIGEMALMGEVDGRRSADVVAEGPVEFLKIGKDDFRAMLRNWPHFHRAMTRLADARAQESGRLAASRSRFRQFLLEQLQDGDEGNKVAAARALAERGFAEGVRALLLMADDEWGRHRRMAKDILKEFSKGERGLQMLAEVSTDTDATIRGLAAHYLGRSLRPEALPVLERMLQNERAGAVAKEALRGIGRIGGEAAWRKLAEYLHDTDADMRAAAANALALSADVRPAKFLEVALDDTHGPVQRNDLKYFDRLGPGASDWILRLKQIALEDTERDVREAAVTALARMEPPDELEKWFYGQAMDMPGREEKKANALQALAQVRPSHLSDAQKRAIEHHMLHGISRDMRQAASLLLMQHHSGSVLRDLLRKNIQHRDANVRAAVAEAYALLQKNGEYAAEEEPLLILAGDRSETVRKAACAGLLETGRADLMHAAITLLNSPDAYQRMSGASLIGSLWQRREDRAWADIWNNIRLAQELAAAKDAPGDIRRWAIERLAENHSTASIRILAGLLGDAAWQEAAQKALLGMGETARHTLEKLLAEEQGWLDRLFHRPRYRRHQAIRRFLNPRESVLARVRSHIAQYDLLKNYFVEYALALRRLVNSEGKDFTVAYGYAGADISGLWLATDFTKAYFINSFEHETGWSITAAQLRHWRDRWEEISLGAPYFVHKRKYGWAQSSDVLGIPEHYLMGELKAMGVNREDIRIEEDGQGRPMIQFSLPGDAKRREIVFVDAKLPLSGQSILAAEWKDSLDVYFQKAGDPFDFEDQTHLRMVQHWIKPEGFIVFNNKDDYGNGMPETSLWDNSFFHAVSSLKKSLWEWWIAQWRYHREGYGWLMDIWQKMQSDQKGEIAPEPPSPESQGNLGGGSSASTWFDSAALAATMAALLLATHAFFNQQIPVGGISEENIANLLRGGALTLLPPKSALLGVAGSMLLLGVYRLSNFLADALGQALNSLSAATRYPDMARELMQLGIFASTGYMLGFSLACMIAPFSLAAIGGLAGTALSSLVFMRSLDGNSSFVRLAADIGNALTAIKGALPSLPEWTAAEREGLVLRAFQMNMNAVTAAVFGHDADKVCMDGKDWNASETDAIKAAVKEAMEAAGQLPLHVHGVDFFIHPKALALMQGNMGVNIFELMKYERAINAESFKEREVVVAHYEKSPFLIGDHAANGLIGVNAAFEAMQEPMRSVLIKVGLGHELMHESGWTDEEKLTRQDIAHTMKLLEMLQPSKTNHYEQTLQGLHAIADMESEFPIGLLRQMMLELELGPGHQEEAHLRQAIGTALDFLPEGESKSSLLEASYDVPLRVEALRNIFGDDWVNRQGIVALAGLNAGSFYSAMHKTVEAYGADWVRAHWDDLLRMSKASKGNIFDLWAYALPDLRKKFGQAWVDAHWDDLLRLSIAAQDKTPLLFTRGFQKLIKGMGRDWFDAHWDRLVKLGVSSGREAARVFAKGILAMAQSRGAGWLDKYWNSLIRLARKSRGNDREAGHVAALFEKGIPAMGDYFQADPMDYGPGLLRMARAAANQRAYFWKQGLDLLIERYKRHLKNYWDLLVEVMEIIGPRQNILWERGFLPMQWYIGLATNIRERTRDLAELYDLVDFDVAAFFRDNDERGNSHGFARLIGDYLPPVWVRAHWGELMQAFRSAGKGKATAMLYGLLGIIEQFKWKWFDKHWHSLFSIVHAAKSKAAKVLLYDLPALHHIYGQEWMDEHWVELSQKMIEAGENASQALWKYSFDYSYATAEEIRLLKVSKDKAVHEKALYLFRRAETGAISPEALPDQMKDIPEKYAKFILRAAEIAYGPRQNKQRALAEEGIVRYRTMFALSERPRMFKELEAMADEGLLFGDTPAELADYYRVPREACEELLHRNTLAMDARMHQEIQSGELGGLKRLLHLAERGGLSKRRAQMQTLGIQIEYADYIVRVAEEAYRRRHPSFEPDALSATSL